jgi:hypothetical protein
VKTVRSVLLLHYGLDNRGIWCSIASMGKINFSPLHSIQTGHVAHLASYPMCIRCSFSGAKLPERVLNHSFQSSAKVKNIWSHIPTRLYSVMLN